MKANNRKLKMFALIKKKERRLLRINCKKVTSKSSKKVVVAINPMLPRKYSMAERLELKAFEQSVFSASKKE